MRIGFIQRYGQLRIDFAVRNGFKSLELAVVPEDYILPANNGWKDKASRLKADLDQAGLRISCIGGLYVNHFDKEKAEFFAAFTKNTIRLAEFLNVPTVAGFAGKLIDRPLEESIEPFKKVWSRHAKFAEDHGIKIAFENCPMGWHHLPPGGNNCLCTPLMWEACFNAVPSDALGLEWDPSHLIGLMIDPIQNLRAWASKVYHVHAKDAKVYRFNLDKNGIFAHGSVEHCMPGFGDTDWAQVVKELLRAGYRSDLNIEGWHDAVYNNGMTPTGEDLGLILAYRHLSQFVDEP
jgi:sugar phosphate isomerase/epimerase